MDEMSDSDHAAHQACYDGTMDAYFSIQSALASDNLALAKSTASKLDENVANAECSTKGEDCCAEIAGAAHGIANANDIAAARSAFNDFSKVMLARVESHAPEQAVYQMYCPMAFNNKGASWLQNNDNLRNPYFGSAMLTCGSTKATFGKASAEHGGMHDHHSH